MSLSDDSNLMKLRLGRLLDYKVKVKFLLLAGSASGWLGRVPGARSSATTSHRQERPLRRTRWCTSRCRTKSGWVNCRQHCFWEVRFCYGRGLEVGAVSIHLESDLDFFRLELQ